MGLIEDLVEDVVSSFGGLKEQIVDDLAGNHDEMLLRRLRNNYDNIPVPALEAIRDNLGHERGEEKPCRACKVIADEEFKLSEFD